MTAVRELMTRRACQRLKVARLSPMRVPPPMPCAMSASLSTARVTSRSRREAGVEDEGLGLPKGIDHTVQEAHEERGVEAHGAGGVEQEHETQRLDLAA